MDSKIIFDPSTASPGRSHIPKPRLPKKLLGVSLKGNYTMGVYDFSAPFTEGIKVQCLLQGVQPVKYFVTLKCGHKELKRHAQPISVEDIGTVAQQLLREEAEDRRERACMLLAESDALEALTG